MAKKVDIRCTCKDCAFFKDGGFCVKKNTWSRAIYYACDSFQTPEQIQELIEKRKKERLEREEIRLNFLLTSLYISATSTQMLLEYFDAQFGGAKVESDWRFSRKRAAKDITEAANRMRTLYHHTFMQDQTKVMTAHGTKSFDCEAYDNHESDARLWALYLLYHLDRCWQNDDAEKLLLETYKALPDNGIFDRKDYEHFMNR